MDLKKMEPLILLEKCDLSLEDYDQKRWDYTVNAYLSYMTYLLSLDVVERHNLILFNSDKKELKKLFEKPDDFLKKYGITLKDYLTSSES